MIKDKMFFPVLMTIALSTFSVGISRRCKDHITPQKGLSPPEARVYFLCSSRCALHCGLELFRQAVCADFWVRNPKMAVMTQKGCKSFSNRFHEFKGFGIKGYNNKGYYMKTMKRCKQLCIRSFTFQCRSFEFQHHWSSKYKNCHLSSAMYMDVPPHMRDHGLPNGWSYVSRACREY